MGMSAPAALPPEAIGVTRFKKMKAVDNINRVSDEASWFTRGCTNAQPTRVKPDAVYKESVLKPVAW